MKNNCHNHRIGSYDKLFFVLGSKFKLVYKEYKGNTNRYEYQTWGENHNMLDGSRLIERKNKTRYTIFWEAWCLMKVDLMLYINTLRGDITRHYKHNNVYNVFTELYIFEQRSGEDKLLPLKDLEWKGQ